MEERSGAGVPLSGLGVYGCGTAELLQKQIIFPGRLLNNQFPARQQDERQEGNVEGTNRM